MWLPNGWWAGEAEEVTDPDIRTPLLRQVLIDTGFAAHAVGIEPVGMTNAELEAATVDYRLIHIRRTGARTGLGGPGRGTASRTRPLALK